LYQAPRGTQDVLPQQQPYWSYVKQTAVAVCDLYGYQRIDTPAFEDAGLFARSIGEDTDIVQKEMYSLEDRSGAKLTLRPEGTASVCRAYIEHGMHSLPQPVRLYYVAPIFRYERPQAGRFRQHHQFGAEAIGNSDPAVDAEVIDMAWQFYSKLGLKRLALHLNSIGCGVCRPNYLESLQAYYGGHTAALCSDCRRRLAKNPLRLLDCKNDRCQLVAEAAPRSAEYLCHDCAAHFDQLRAHLTVLRLPMSLNHRLVRGLDYYNRTVFEIGPEGEAASQATIGGGGRYDGLIGQLGGKSTPGVGFGSGIERLVLNLKKQGIDIPALPAPAVFVAYMGDDGKKDAIAVASTLRESGIAVTGSFGDRSLKAQLKQANTAGTRFAVIIGEDEAKNRAVVLRDMDKGEQRTVPAHSLADQLTGLLDSEGE
jgi:histidyl-tRNA synthetase